MDLHIIAWFLQLLQSIKCDTAVSGVGERGLCGCVIREVLEDCSLSFIVTMHERSEFV